jgi:hypothetical protein
MNVHEENAFLKTYITMLKKEAADKDVELGKLTSYIQELESERKLVKGDRKRLKENILIRDYHERLTEAGITIARLKKDNSILITKLNQK